MTPARSGERGVAIVSALVVLVVAAAIGTAAALRQSLWQRQFESDADVAQAKILARAGVAYAAAVLYDDQRRSAVDHLQEGWTTRLPPTAVETGEISGGVSDLQGRFNLNNVVREGVAEEASVAQFRRLLGLLSLPASLADSLVDWVDADSVPYGASGAEDAFYLSQNPPYRAANRLLGSVDDLARVRGFTPDVRAALAPFVMAAPAFADINVNTAPPVVLASMFREMTLADAQALAGERDRIYFKDKADFKARHRRKDLALDDAHITTITSYFLVEAVSRYGRASVTSQAMVYRHPSLWPDVVWHRFD